jgi:hypothetical protein
MRVIGLRIRRASIDWVFSRPNWDMVAATMMTVALLSSTNRVIMETEPDAHHGLIGL